MTAENTGRKTRMGRPAIDSEAVNVRLERAYLKALDVFSASQSDLPGRPEAIRRILDEFFRNNGYIAS
ncbi:MAG: hypothetical protein FWD68_00675 [Alphaproteobacteria bacterium]|nr:hypothetical protein [Alphaproteobacteria bacterium]